MKVGDFNSTVQQLLPVPPPPDCCINTSPAGGRFNPAWGVAEAGDPAGWERVAGVSEAPAGRAGADSCGVAGDLVHATAMRTTSSSAAAVRTGKLLHARLRSATVA